MFNVLIPFRTSLQRFIAGDRLYNKDVLFPHTLESLIDAGLVENQLDPKIEKKSAVPKAPVEPAPEPEPQQ
jgi:hypothetical protein